MVRRKIVGAVAAAAMAAGMVACEMATPVEPIIAPEESTALPDDPADDT